MKKQVANYLYDDNVLSYEYQIIYADDGQQRRRPWALPAGLEKRNGALGDDLFFDLVRRKYDFSILSSILPMVSLCYSY